MAVMFAKRQVGIVTSCIFRLTQLNVNQSYYLTLNT